MSERKRLELRQTYAEGWDTWDSDLLCSSLAEGFYFDDPAIDKPVTIDSMPDYMNSWNSRVKGLGGTGVITSKDRAVQDVDGAYITWHWWGFEGTNYEGSAMTRTTDRGVEYERITYYPNTPSFK